MKSSELVKRYAKALFEIAIDNRTQEKALSDLRQLEALFSADTAIRAFLSSPTVSPAERVQALKAALESAGLSPEVLSLTLLLAKKNRLVLFADLAMAFQAEIDSANNVCRGTVRSAAALAPAERLKIEETVERVLNKKVIMTYRTDDAVIGGLVAQVGSYTFDDSIVSHLRRMNEELKRRAV